jgi:hypothetical protein
MQHPGFSLCPRRLLSGIFACAALLQAAPALSAAEAAGSPLLPLLRQFTASDVPAMGPEEVAQERNWVAPASPPAWPGGGLARHTMLYAGEGYNTLFLVHGGSVIWSYSTGRGGEIDDVWMMSNGNILFTRQNFAAEVTPRKQIVWRYDAPPGTEVHSAQPIGLDKVLLVRNGLPPLAMIINKRTQEVETQHPLPAVSLTDQKTVHSQFRRIRMTGAGTYLVPFLKMNRVAEYDRDFKEIWAYEIPTPWSAIRLHTGNTLIVSESQRLVREVNPAGDTVWEFGQKDIPADMGLQLRNLQTCDRLANGNTVIFSAAVGVKKEDRPGIIQAVEVTPDKKIVWVLQDWKNLGPATTAQFLDQPGIPEVPGALMH